MQGLEQQLAKVLASGLEEAARLRTQGVALMAENRRLRAAMEEAGLEIYEPSSLVRSSMWSDAEEDPMRRSARRMQTGQGSATSTRRMARSPPRASTGAAVEAEPPARGATRSLTLLASMAPASVAPEHQGPGEEAVKVAKTKTEPLAAQDFERHANSGGPSPSQVLEELPLSSTRSPRTVTVGVADDASGAGEEDAEQHEVEVQQIWKDMNTPHIFKKGYFLRTQALMKKRAGSSPGLGAQRLILPPTANRRIFWEAIGAISIIYDLITVPLQAFNLHYNSAFMEQVRVSMIYVHVIYWTLDVPCSFFVGFYVNGVLESRVKQTAKRYLTTWFLVDICLVTCDWIMFGIEVSGIDSYHLSYLMYGRVLRLLRFLRLVRLLKLHSMFNKLLESIHSEYMLTFMRVSEHVLFIVCLNHFIACAWYWIGTLNTGETWIEDNFRDWHTTTYRYMTSLHWSLTQFTPASMEVFPTNAGERTYNVCVVILAMVTFSTFISSITEAMTRLRKSNGRKAAQELVLRQYLGENQVSMQLAMRIWRYLEHGAKARRLRKMWRDVELFREIPDSLQMDLHHEVYMPILTGHPFFNLYNEQSPVAMRAICHYATQEVSLVSEQVLFGEGQVADKMFFIIEGLVEYSRHHGSELSGAWIKQSKLTYPDWMCEAVVWVRWFYHGNAVAKQVSSLLALHAPTLHQIMKEYLGTVPYCCNYAERFAEYVRSNSGYCDFEEDAGKMESMAQEAFEYVESTCNPNPVMVAPEPVPAPPGKRKVTWGRRRSLLSSRAGTRHSGSHLSFLGHFLPGSSVGSTSSMGEVVHDDARPNIAEEVQFSNSRSERMGVNETGDGHSEQDYVGNQPMWAVEELPPRAAVSGEASFGNVIHSVSI